jgi:hypothetical protein
MTVQTNKHKMGILEAKNSIRSYQHYGFVKQLTLQ